MTLKIDVFNHIFPKPFFDRLPGVRIVAHHLGAMVPYFEGRVGYGLDQFGSRTADEDYAALLASPGKRPQRLLQDVLGGHGRVRQPRGDRMRPSILPCRSGRLLRPTRHSIPKPARSISARPSK
jgi:hypothetical protein